MVRFRSASSGFGVLPSGFSCPAILAFAGLSLLASCSSGDRTNDVGIVGRPDRTDDGWVSIDEAALTGTLESGSLEIEIPITAHAQASGMLNVELESVDGKRKLGSTTVNYDLASAQATKLKATLGAPADVSTQADLAQYKVVVEETRADRVRVIRSLMYVIPLYELTLEGPATLRKGKPSSYRVQTRDGYSKRPLADVEIDVQIDRDGVLEHQTLRTSATGDGVVPLSTDEAGKLKLSVKSAAFGSNAELAQQLEVKEDGPKLLLTSDKPIYKPGQMLHLRSLTLASNGNAPVSGADVSFEILDAKGNKISKRAGKTDNFGVAATDFQLGPIVNEGTFTIRVTSGEVKNQKTVQVSQYALPKFDVAVKTEKAWYKPSQIVTGTIDAHYFFGKLVSAGSVLVEALSLDVGETVFQRIIGTLDESGHYQFSIQLPAVLAGSALEGGNALVNLRVTVTDSAGQKVSKNVPVAVAQQGASLALVPEATDLVPGIENRLMLFLSDPLGAPIENAKITLTAPSGERLGATTDDFGQAELGWTPTTTSGSFSAQVSLESGEQIAQSFTFKPQLGAAHVIVRTDKSVYETGESVKVEVLSSDESANVYVDWLNDGQTVDMRTLTSEHGSAKFNMPIDSALTGSNRIEAHIVDANGNIVRAGRTIFARNDSALKIVMDSDKTVYAPGEPAKLSFSVTDEQGKPKVAALGVQIVDQAVFALIDSKPGLLRTYFELNDSFNKPSYEIKGPQVSFDGLFFNETTVTEKDQAAAAQRKSAGALAALGASSPMGIRAGSYEAVILAATSALKPPVEAVKPELIASLQALTTKGLRLLEQQGCQRETYCVDKQQSFGVALRAYLRTEFKAYDFWGNQYAASLDDAGLSLSSAGPDERKSSKDDIDLRIENKDFIGDLRLDVSLPAAGGFNGSPSASPPGNRANDPASPNPSFSAGPEPEAPASDDSAGASTDTDQGRAEPRVRTDFPETLYANPSIITDAKGHASIDVTMADSITEWRVSTLANSADGRLGGAESGLKVFQDFFVDVSFPATLTRGDEVSFPIAVYNYLDTPQTVQLSLQPGTWYSALGTTSTSVKLEPGQVSGVSFPVRVNEVGLQTLTVQAIGSLKSDAVARSVRVIPDGKAFPESHSGALKAGDVSQAVTVPTGTIPGSAELYVNVFPAFVSQAVQGMDSLLRVPNGCFEQTTSTAWPNVLVTQYMKDTKQITPEIQLKAEALMSAGYQRLLTFEHPGGGFSWFGTQDKAPFLSVTAFGLMEFADMAKVQTVDEAMLERTKKWLVAQQAQNGSWAGDMSEFFSFQTSVVRNTAFVVWALASAGVTTDAVTRGLSYVKANLGADQDPYTLGLVANAFALAAADDSFLAQVLSKLDSLKKVNGERVSWDSGGTQTNFYCSGAEADVSASALVVQALIKVGGYKSSVDGGLKFLLANKDPQGNFGSTQSTIWTLRALIEAARHSGEPAVGDLSVFADGELVQKLALSAAQSDVMTTVDLGAHAAIGSHDVQLAFNGTGQLSYNLVSSYHLPWATLPAEPEGPIAISLSYDKASLYVNETVSATAVVKNTTSTVENMVLVTLGVAPGFQVQTADLETYLRQGTLSRYELTGRQLILYLTALAPKASATFSYRLQALMPVKAVDGGAEAHLYYEPSKRAQTAGQAFEVKN
ncbi:MAG: MG2 domain-containing protein [Pseudomonadota bacterium]